MPKRLPRCRKEAVRYYELPGLSCEYKATRELLVELLARVDDGRITFHNPELKQELRANLIAVKKVDKEAIELERSWRKLARSIRMDKRRLKEFGY
jgi:hypothetical protein